MSFLRSVGDGSGTALVGLKVVGQGPQQTGYFRFDHAGFAVGDTLTFTWTPTSPGGHIGSAALYSAVPAQELASAAVPEPGTTALMLAGLLVAGVASRRRKVR